MLDDAAVGMDKMRWKYNTVAGRCHTGGVCVYVSVGKRRVAYDGDMRSNTALDLGNMKLALVRHGSEIDRTHVWISDWVNSTRVLLRTEEFRSLAVYLFGATGLLIVLPGFPMRHQAARPSQGFLESLEGHIRPTAC